MKKIINKVENIVPEMVSGAVKAYPKKIRRIKDTNVIIRNDEEFNNSQDKIVGIVSGGGSGHEPLHFGYVGKGMLSATVSGEIFTSPTPDQIYKAIKETDKGAGVLLIVKNYSGDVMNFDMAREMAEGDNIQVESIVVNDDVSIEDSQKTQGKRGVSGTVFVEKIVGAAAQQGATLSELKELGQAVIDNTKTIGVALKAATVPDVGKPGFELKDDEIEFGIGIHNERGYSVEKMGSSHEIAEELINKIMKNFDTDSGKFAVLVNGMGATPLMEQYVFTNDVLDILKDKDIDVEFTKVGNMCTSIDMEGISLTISKVTDKMISNLEYDTNTIAW